MEQKTNYGKIIAITLSVITAAVAIAFVVYRLLRSLIEFCAVRDDLDEADESLDFDETDELLFEEEAAADGEENTPDTEEATEI